MPDKTPTKRRGECWPRNHPAHDLAMIALKMAELALEELVEALDGHECGPDPGTVAWAEKEGYSPKEARRLAGRCTGCELEYDAQGILYAVSLGYACLDGSAFLWDHHEKPLVEELIARARAGIAAYDCKAQREAVLRELPPLPPEAVIPAKPAAGKRQYWEAD